MPTLPFARLVRRSPWLLTAIGFAAACSSSSNTTGTTSTSSSTSTSTSSSSSTGLSTSGGGSTSSSSGTGGGATCSGKGYAGGEMPMAGAGITAKIIDQNGAAAPMQPVFICGIDLCSPPSKTAADGTVTLNTSLTMKKAALKFGDALTYAELAIPLSMAMSDFGTIATAKLPDTGATLAAGMDATSGNVTVSIPAGSAVSFNELVYDTPDKQGFRAAEIPVVNAKPVIDASKLGFEILVGVSPAGTTFCPAAKVTAPNSAGWPAGTAVEFYVMTVDAGQEYAPYAGWAKASDGAVSADGKTVVTTDGQGFNYLDVFGVRKKP